MNENPGIIWPWQYFVCGLFLIFWPKKEESQVTHVDVCMCMHVGVSYCACVCVRKRVCMYLVCVCVLMCTRERERERERERIKSTFILQQVNDKEEEFCEQPSSSGIPVKLLYCCFWVGPEKPEHDGSVPHNGQCWHSVWTQWQIQSLSLLHSNILWTIRTAVSLSLFLWLLSMLSSLGVGVSLPSSSLHNNLD